MAKEDWITMAEAAKLTGYHRNHILRLLEGGKVKAQKWGREWQVMGYTDLDSRAG